MENVRTRLKNVARRLRGVVDDSLLVDCLDMTSPPRPVMVRLERDGSEGDAYECVYDGYGMLVQSIVVPKHMVCPEEIVHEQSLLDTTKGL